MTDIRQAARNLWDFHCVYDDLRPSDVIIGLGSYDIRVAVHCSKLFQDGLSDRIIFTGASGNWTRGLLQASEAAAFKEQAVAEGVPEEAIMLERRATNIGDYPVPDGTFDPALLEAMLRSVPILRLSDHHLPRLPPKRQS